MALICSTGCVLPDFFSPLTVEVIFFALYSLCLLGVFDVYRRRIFPENEASAFRVQGPASRGQNHQESLQHDIENHRPGIGCIYLFIYFSGADLIMLFVIRPMPHRILVPFLFATDSILTEPTQ